jgi:hypothetical protein
MNTGSSNLATRKLILAASMLTLLAALWGGWVRMGLNIPAIQPQLSHTHGALMVAGFLGTLIALERAVAIGRGVVYLVPAVNGLGAMMMVLGLPARLGLPPVLPLLLMGLGSLGLVLIFAYILRSHRQGYLVVMALGAAALLVANLLWITGWPIFRFVMWWAAFLVLTVAGERLELGRLKPPGRLGESLFFTLTGIYVGGLFLLLLLPDWGTRLTGLGLVGLALWLLRFDIAWRTMRRPGLPRFAAVCLLGGYVWLAAAGVLALIFGMVGPGMSYDAVLHAIFLGFTFSMIFGHAPIIFPAILKRPVQFTPWFYLHLGLLHASMLVRFFAGITGNYDLRLWAGLFNGIALLLFVALTAYSVFVMRPAAETAGALQKNQPSDQVAAARNR